MLETWNMRAEPRQKNKQVHIIRKKNPETNQIKEIHQKKDQIKNINLLLDP